MKIRYYASNHEIDSEVLNLLVQVKTRHGIEYEISQIRMKESKFGTYADPEHQKEIYTKDFKPRARTLKSRIGESVARALRSQQGRGGYFVAGTIALVEENKVEWFACNSDPLYQTWKSYDEEHPLTLGLLKMILDKGINQLEKEVIDRGKESEHDKLIKQFVNSNLLPGKFREEVSVGKAMFVVDKYGEKKETGKKSIDLVCETPTENWVIEVEPRLNATALGQVLVYSELYSQTSSIPTKLGIVCKDAEEELLRICEKYVDKVFVLGEIRRKKTVD